MTREELIMRAEMSLNTAVSVHEFEVDGVESYKAYTERIKALVALSDQYARLATVREGL